MASLRPYIYTPLFGIHSSRVLHLKSGSNADPLGGILETVDLEDHPQYEALSYEWGDPEKHRSILLHNNSLLRINTSLYHALQDMRYENDSKGTRTIWADAVGLYVDRYQRKYHRNLRFEPLFSKSFRFASRIHVIRLRVALPILCLDLCILALKCMNFTFRGPCPKFKMKLFLAISIPVIPIDHGAAPLTNRVRSDKGKDVV
jgi:hypothetical protein